MTTTSFSNESGATITTGIRRRDLEESNEDYCCGCGCPWSIAGPYTDADVWRREKWFNEMIDPEVPGHKKAVCDLREYWEPKWAEILEEHFMVLFEEHPTKEDMHGLLRKSFLEGGTPATMLEMIKVRFEDEDEFGCEDCSDEISGNRCFRNRKKRRMCA